MEVEKGGYPATCEEYKQWIKEAGGTAAGYKPLATRIGDKEKPLHKFSWSYQRFMADLVALNGVVPMPRRCCAAWPLKREELMLSVAAIAAAGGGRTTCKEKRFFANYRLQVRVLDYQVPSLPISPTLLPAWSVEARKRMRVQRRR